MDARRLYPMHGAEERGCDRTLVQTQMMKNLLVSEGDIVCVRNVSLAPGTFAKFEPQSVDFLDISDPRAVYVHSKAKILGQASHCMFATSPQCAKFEYVATRGAKANNCAGYAMPSVCGSPPVLDGADVSTHFSGGLQNGEGSAAFCVLV
jgi:hypothetical protein